MSMRKGGLLTEVEGQTETPGTMQQQSEDHQREVMTISVSWADHVMRFLLRDHCWCPVHRPLTFLNLLSNYQGTFLFQFLIQNLKVFLFSFQQRPRMYFLFPIEYIFDKDVHHHKPGAISCNLCMPCEYILLAYLSSSTISRQSQNQYFLVR